VYRAVFYAHTYARIAELNQLTGIAAILTFPLDVEVVEAEEREAKLEQESAATELATDKQ
jgi:protein pelota